MKRVIAFISIILLMMIALYFTYMGAIEVAKVMKINHELIPSMSLFLPDMVGEQKVFLAFLSLEFLVGFCFLDYCNRRYFIML